jgi:hypothetical protein
MWHKCYIPHIRNTEVLGQKYTEQIILLYDNSSLYFLDI